jgi:hypothetical protein
MKNRIRCITILVSILCFCACVFTFEAQSQCPPCYYNQPPLPGHGPGPGGRRIILIKIETAGQYSWSDQPGGGTNPKIWNGLNGCVGCPGAGAIEQWNNTTDASGNKTYYYFQNDQNLSPDILIEKRIPQDPGACMSIVRSGSPPHSLKIPPGTENHSHAAIAGGIAHEIGHRIGLHDNYDPTTCATIMNQNSFSCGIRYTYTVQAIDIATSNQQANISTRGDCTIGDISYPTNCVQTCLIGSQYGSSYCGPVDPCRWPNGGCPNNCTALGTCCVKSSPILIDTAGNGFNLTDIANGTRFDMAGEGNSKLMSWTALNSDDAFLVLDRNGNGTIDNGSEFFGNFTLQPVTSDPNGFIALAEYDKSGNGGNNDGKITSQDAIYASLRLWKDLNHNAISEYSELFTLASLGLATMDLDYKESRRTDQYGNQFKYRAKVKDIHGAHLGRWAWDVFFITE